jgi:tRNA U34 5-carboxymethylaminomethyl modifying GTPase MnmE/TrmE
MRNSLDETNIYYNNQPELTFLRKTITFEDYLDEDDEVKPTKRTGSDTVARVSNALESHLSNSVQPFSKSSKRARFYKVVVLGNSGVGKTSLLT